LHKAARQAKRNLGRCGKRVAFIARSFAAIVGRMANPGKTTAERLLAFSGMRRMPTPRAELFDRPGFLSPEMCEALIALIDRDRRPSTIADENGDAYFRTSETCDLPAEHPTVQALEQSLLELNGIDPAHGEPVQGQRYLPGQEFKAHTDYFEPTGRDFAKFCSVAGQRTWTFMIYLNTVEAGGATRFKEIGKTFKPEAGKLICWNNHRPDGTLNGDTLHHGMKVRKGVKYVITKWYRERPWE
jgi:prolyl 4-hydroxylase